MSRTLLDSNLIIYAAQPGHDALRRLIAREAPSVSVVSKVETLGYPDLAPAEEQFLTEFFDVADVRPTSSPVVATAIQCRQQRRMSLGDALIAGTALSHDLRLATRNTDDFTWIDDLAVFDPIEEDE
jgi:predicted nucleic acid-binding protein